MLPGVNTIQHSISDLLIVVFVMESYARLLYTIPVRGHFSSSSKFPSVIPDLAYIYQDLTINNKKTPDFSV